MPVNVSCLMQVLAEICNEKDIRAAESESLKGGVLAGTSAGLGGLIFGPIGLALGGAIGGIAAAALSYGKFKPVAQILIEMSPEQKQLLYKKLQRAFSEFSYEDVVGLAMLIMSTASFKELAVKEIINFLVNDMKMSIQS